MNEFERRWEIGAAEVRKATPVEAAQPPFGFATRVAAQWQAERKPGPSALSIWETFSRRTLVGLAVVLLFTVLLSWPAEGQNGIVRPPLEDTVTELFSTL